MKLKGNYTFDAPRDLVWQALLDPEVLAKILPGCQQLEQVGEGEYKGILKIKVGPVQGVFQGSVTLSDYHEPERYHLQIQGQGGPGFVKGEGDIRLEEQGEQTVMSYDSDVQVGGRIASIGQRLLDSSTKTIIRQSLKNLNKQIQAQVEAQQDAYADAKVNEVSAENLEDISEKMNGSAPEKTTEEILNHFIPPDKRSIYLKVGVTLVGVAALVIVAKGIALPLLAKAAIIK